MVLPESAAYVLEKLENAGFEAYVVGGCVRDALLGLEPKDYDVCTNALPEQTETAFAGERVIENRADPRDGDGADRRPAL